jgi:catechol-2,3-dioxygenase
MFRGLSYLNDLNLLNSQRLELNNQSFSSLSNIGNVYLNVTNVIENKCIYTQTFEREIKRKLGNKYTFLSR